MASKTFCDLCNKQVKTYQEFIYLRNPEDTFHYCLNCWTNKKNWPLIHHIKDSDQESTSLPS